MILRIHDRLILGFAEESIRSKYHKNTIKNFGKGRARGYERMIRGTRFLLQMNTSTTLTLSFWCMLELTVRGDRAHDMVFFSKDTSTIQTPPTTKRRDTGLGADHL